MGGRVAFRRVSFAHAWGFSVTPLRYHEIRPRNPGCEIQAIPYIYRNRIIGGIYVYLIEMDAAVSEIQYFQAEVGSFIIDCASSTGMDLGASSLRWGPRTYSC